MPRRISDLAVFAIAAVVATDGRLFAARRPVPKLVPQKAENNCWAASAAMALQAVGKTDVGQCSVARTAVPVAQGQCACLGGANALGKEDRACSGYSPYEPNDYVPAAAMAVPTAYVPKGSTKRFAISADLVWSEVEKEGRPVIVWLNRGQSCPLNGHMVVVDGIQGRVGTASTFVHVVDPAPEWEGSSYDLEWSEFACGSFDTGHCVAYYEVGLHEPPITASGRVLAELVPLNAVACMRSGYSQIEALKDALVKDVSNGLAPSITAAGEIIAKLKCSPTQIVDRPLPSQAIPMGPTAGERTSELCQGLDASGNSIGRPFIVKYRQGERNGVKQFELISFGFTELVELFDKTAIAMGNPAVLHLIENPNGSDAVLIKPGSDAAIRLSSARSNQFKLEGAKGITDQFEGRIVPIQELFNPQKLDWKDLKSGTVRQVSQEF